MLRGLPEVTHDLDNSCERPRPLCRESVGAHDQQDATRGITLFNGAGAVNRTRFVFWMLLGVSGLALVLTLRFRRPAVGAVSVPPPAAGQARDQPLVERWVSRRSAARTPGAELPAVTSHQFSIAALVQGGTTLPRLSPSALAAHVERNGNSAESLLAAFRHSRDTNWLHQAAEKHASDPRVQLQVLALNLYPEQRGQWIEFFK